MGCLTCLEKRCSPLLRIPLGRQARLLKASSIRTFQGLFSKIFSKAVPKVHFIQFPSTFPFLPETTRRQATTNNAKSCSKGHRFPKSFPKGERLFSRLFQGLSQRLSQKGQAFPCFLRANSKGQGQGPSASVLTTSPSRGLRQSKKYTRPGSNWRPSACEADVIATRPLVPRVFFRVWNSVV